MMVKTSPIRTPASSGPEDGVPVRLVHDNLTTGRFWQDLADSYRRISTADGLVA
jgi:hypothetical protein